MSNSPGPTAGVRATQLKPVVFTSPYRLHRFQDELEFAVKKRLRGAVACQGSPARKRPRVGATRRRRGARQASGCLPARVIALNLAAVSAAIQVQEACTVAAVRECMLSLSSAGRPAARLGPGATDTDRLVAFFAYVLVHRASLASPRCQGPKPRGSTEECRCAFAHTMLGRALELSGWRACNFPDCYAPLHAVADSATTYTQLLHQAGAAEVHRALQTVLDGIAARQALRLRHQLDPGCSLAMWVLGARAGDPLWLWYRHEFVPAQLDSVVRQTEQDTVTVRLRVVGPGAAGSGQPLLPWAPGDRASLARGLAALPNSALGEVLASRLARADSWAAGYALCSFQVQARHGVPAGALAAAEWPGYFAQAFELVEVVKKPSDHAGAPAKGALCLPLAAPQQPFRRFWQLYLDPHLRAVHRGWPAELSVLVGSYLLGGGGLCSPPPPYTE